MDWISVEKGLPAPGRAVWFHDTVTRITFLGHLSEDERWLNWIEGGGRWNAGDATHWAVIKPPALPKQTKPDCNHFVPSAHGHTATCARWVASRGAIYACDPGAEWCEYEPLCDAVDALRRCEVHKLTTIERDIFNALRRLRHRLDKLEGD